MPETLERTLSLLSSAEESTSALGEELTLPEALQDALSLLPSAGEPAVFTIADSAEEEKLLAMKRKGFSLQLKQCQAYWHEEMGVVILGKATSDYKQQVLKVLRTCWFMQHIARRVDLKLDTLVPQAKKTMQAELHITPAALKHLPEISEKLRQLRLLDMLLGSPSINGSELLGESVQLRILFNEIADEELEIWDYYEAVWERLEQYQDYYESWHEKLIEYRSFLQEAILEILIIVILFLDYLVKR